VRWTCADCCARGKQRAWREAGRARRGAGACVCVLWSTHAGRSKTSSIASLCARARPRLLTAVLRVRNTRRARGAFARACCVQRSAAATNARAGLACTHARCARALTRRAQLSLIKPDRSIV
jgi:hypothetical protein